MAPLPAWLHLDAAGVALFSALAAALVWLLVERVRRDRTSRRAQNSLADRLASVLQAVNDAILLVDVRGRIVEANDRAVEMYGLSLVELRQRNIRELRAPEQRASVEADLQQAVAMEGLRKETVHVRRDGTCFPVELSIRPVRADGPLYYRTIVRDITRQRESELVLREREETLRSITLAAKDAIVMLDERGRITFWNRAAEDLFGYDASEVLGRVLHDFLAPERFLTQHRAAFGSWQASGQGQAIGTTVEFAAIRKDSKEITIELSLSSVKVRDRWHAIGIIRDVGARKQAERDLLEAKQAAEAASGKLELANVQLEAAARTARESTAQAESANAAKGEFLARMSHEIRTPMNAIIGMTGLLLDTPLAAEQREYAGIVRTSADALLVIVNDILDFSKIEAGKLDMESIDFHLHDLVEETTRMFAVKAQEKGLRLTCVLAADVPARLRGDPGRLRQILLNLIGNAIKFTARGEVAIRVALDAQDDARATLRFTVRDTGIGIPADGIASLFQSFSQVDSSITRRFGGTGLGLAVSRSLVALMGGQIGVESAPNDGSTFWFTAVFEKQGMTTASPAAPAPSAAALATGDATGAPSERPRMPTTSPSSVGDRGRPLRALVTDDNVVNQKVAVGLLRRLGFRADAAGSGAEALAALDTTPYDLVLMDVQMPEMDGFAVTRAIRQREAATGRHLPVIAMTAHAMTGDRERCLAEGMDGYVSKPIDRAQMATALEALPGMPVRSAVEVPTPVSPPAEVFNRHELVARLGGDEPLVVEVIDAFLEDAPGIRSELARATAAGDVQTLTRLGHLLKGSSATLGAHALRISAAELERVGRAGDVKQSQAQASVVDREYDRLIHVLSATDVTS